LAVDGWAVTFGTVRRQLGPSRLRLAAANVAAHPSMASVPITVLVYNGLLLCGLNVCIKGLMTSNNISLMYTAPHTYTI